MTEIKHPFSVIDGRAVHLKDAFSWVLNYYNPRKNIPEVMPYVLDSTCSKMIMWHKKDFNRFNIITNDISSKIEADYHKDVAFLYKFIDIQFDMAIYDPPYIDLKNRRDSEKYEKIFRYDSMPTIEKLEELTIQSSISFNKLLKKDGILIAKITDFHHERRIRGHHDFINWFSDNFYLWDIIIYRFYKSIPNLNRYNRKCAKTHSYFLIFKKNK